MPRRVGRHQAPRVGTAVERTDIPPYAGLIRGGVGFAVLLAAAAVVAAVVGTGATDLPPVTGLAEPGPVVQFGIPVARTLLDVCAVTAAGVAILARLVGFDRPKDTEPVMRSARLTGLWASVGWTVAALLSIVLLTAELNPGESPGRRRSGRMSPTFPPERGYCCPLRAGWHRCCWRG